MTSDQIIEQFSGQTFSSSEDVRAWLKRSIDAVIAAETDQCAKIADERSKDCSDKGAKSTELGDQDIYFNCAAELSDLARAIRARGTT